MVLDEDRVVQRVMERAPILAINAQGPEAAEELATVLAESAAIREATEATTRQGVQQAAVAHVDETGQRVAG